MTNPSPICLVDGYATTDGVDVTAGATVTIALADTAGVAQWNITCLYTDEGNSSATINSGLSVNLVNKTATFTAPATLGSALIFQSKVNNGIDLNGVSQASYVTTFKVSVLSAIGLRVAAFNETTENDSNFGWVPIINDVARTAMSGATSAGAGLTNSGNVLNVGQNADNTIRVNANDIQLHPDFYSSSLVNSTLVQRTSLGSAVLGDATGVSTYGGSISASATTSFSISQATRASDTACNSLTLTPQAPFATATGSNRLPGDVVFAVPAAVGALATTSSGKVSFKFGGSECLNVSVAPNTSTTTVNATGSLTLTATGGSADLNINSGRDMYFDVGGDTKNVFFNQGGNTFHSFSQVDTTMASESVSISATAGNLSLSADQTINLTGGLSVTDPSGFGITINADGGGTLELSGPAGFNIIGSQISFLPGSGHTVELMIPDNGTATGDSLKLSAGAAATGSGVGGNLILNAGTGSNFSGNVGINYVPPSSDVSTGHLCIYVGSTNAAPTSNPTNGIILYVDSSGNLKARTSAGNVRTIAAV